jgi:hypothetical protein
MWRVTLFSARGLHPLPPAWATHQRRLALSHAPLESVAPASACVERKTTAKAMGSSVQIIIRDPEGRPIVDVSEICERA